LAAADDLVKRLALPEEVSTQQASEILGCCKHTVLQFLDDGLLEWRNAAPPSSNRPVFRFTLRSVLQLRLAYKTGSPRPPREEMKASPPRKRVDTGGYQVKHLRRKGANTSEGQRPSAL
jgi:hypothetical protein